MNPTKTSILAIIAVCGLFTALLVFNESNKILNPENDLPLAQKSASFLADEMENSVLTLTTSIKSLSYNTYWQSSPVTEWGFWLNSQEAIYRAAGISLLGVHSTSNDVLSFEKPSRPGKFQELELPLQRLYQNNEDVTLLQSFRDTPAIIALTAIKDIDNNVIGALVAVKYLDEALLKQFHHQARVPVAIINNNEIKAISTTNISGLDDYNLIDVNWPKAINSSLWKLSLIVKPQNAFSMSLVFMLIGVLLGLILIYIVWKQLDSAKNELRELNKNLDIQKSVEEQISQLTSLQNTATDPDFINLVQAIRLRCEQSIQQQKTLNIQIRKLVDSEKELKRAASSLSNERDDAIAAPRLKSEFLSRMGDEITTPMKSVVSMLKLLSEYQLDAEAKQILNIAKRSTRTLVDNLNNILDFSKLDAEMLKLAPVNFSVRELINDLSSELSHYANEKELSLQASSDPEIPGEVYADKSRIRQILRNLLGNAIRFTKSGEVSLYADLTNIGDKKLLRFTVKDTGVGIPAEAQKGLFDSLEQSSKLTNSSFAGRLRLIVSKNLAELMGGEIGVISETGSGSQFWFTIELES